MDGGRGKLTIRARFSRAAVAALCALLLAAPAAALPPPEDEDNWEFDLALYGWLTDITGEATIGDTTVDVEPQLWNDIVRNLDLAFFGALEARYQNRWILNTDFVFAQITNEDEKGPFPLNFEGRTLTRNLGSRNTQIPIETPIGNLEIPVRVDPGTLRVDIPSVHTTIGPFDIETTLKQYIVRAYAGYRLFDRPLFEETDPRRLRFDLFAGIRYYDMEVEIDIDAPPVDVPPFEVTASLSGGNVRVGSGRFSRTRSLGRIDLPGAEFSGATLGGTDIDQTESAWWIDPIVGARVGADVSEKISVLLMGNVGGFGIGSASDFSWETVAAATYRLGDSWSLIGGYRALGFDREGSDVRLDLIMHGPVVGAVYRF